jgi:hypothetical protein
MAPSEWRAKCRVSSAVDTAAPSGHSSVTQRIPPEARLDRVDGFDQPHVLFDCERLPFLRKLDPLSMTRELNSSNHTLILFIVKCYCDEI